MSFVTRYSTLSSHFPGIDNPSKSSLTWLVGWLAWTRKKIRIRKAPPSPPPSSEKVQNGVCNNEEKRRRRTYRNCQVIIIISMAAFSP
jgi:hypothetical protein